MTFTALQHNQAVANAFQCLIWIFWVCQLSPIGVTFIALHYCLYLTAVNFTSLLDCGMSSSEKSPAQNSENHFWHLQSVTAPSSYPAQIFLCVCFSCIFTFLDIIKYNMLKMFFLPSSILKCLTKIHQFWCFLKMHIDIIAVTLQSKNNCFEWC